MQLWKKRCPHTGSFQIQFKAALTPFMLYSCSYKNTNWFMMQHTLPQNLEHCRHNEFNSPLRTFALKQKRWILIFPKQPVINSVFIFSLMSIKSLSLDYVLPISLVLTKKRIFIIQFLNPAWNHLYKTLCLSLVNKRFNSFSRHDSNLNKHLMSFKKRNVVWSMFLTGLS